MTSNRPSDAFACGSSQNALIAWVFSQPLLAVPADGAYAVPVTACSRLAAAGGAAPLTKPEKQVRCTQRDAHKTPVYTV